MQEQKPQEEELFVVVKDLKDAPPPEVSYGLGSCNCGHCANGE